MDNATTSSMKHLRQQYWKRNLPDELERVSATQKLGRRAENEQVSKRRKCQWVWNNCYCRFIYEPASRLDSLRQETLVGNRLSASTPIVVLRYQNLCQLLLKNPIYSVAKCPSSPFSSNEILIWPFNLIVSFIY